MSDDLVVVETNRGSVTVSPGETTSVTIVPPGGVGPQGIPGPEGPEGPEGPVGPNPTGGQPYDVIEQGPGGDPQWAPLTRVLVLDSEEPIPPATLAGTVILRREP